MPKPPDTIDLDDDTAGGPPPTIDLAMTNPADVKLVPGGMNEVKYGGLGGEAKAFALGLGNTATFGGLNQALVHSGLASPETLKGIQEANPISTGFGTAAGVIGPMLLGDEAAPLGLADLANPVSGVAKIGKAVRGASELGGTSATGKILSSGLSHAAGSAVEGAFYGAGNVVQEQALGDPGLNGEKIATEIGLTSLLAGGLGGILGAADKGLIAGKSKLSALKDAISDTSTVTADVPDVTGAPTSLEDLVDKVNKHPVAPEDLDLPSKATLQTADAITKNNSEFPVHNLQFESLDNPATRDLYRTLRESQTTEGDAIRRYEALQKREGVQQIKKTIQSVAPGEFLTSDAVKAGNQVVDSFEEQYNAEKKELAPLFKRVDEVGITPVADPSAISAKLEEAMPGVTKYLEPSVDQLKLAKYDSTMPFSKNAYGAIKDVIDAINKNELTLGEIRNVRNTVADRLTGDIPARDYQQIGALKKSLMEYIQDEFSKVEPNLDIKDTFKRYAINEERRQAIEKILGGKIGTDNFSKAIKPENVINRLFSNSLTADATKTLLGKDSDKALANFLTQAMSDVTDNAKNGLSSQKFSTFLKNNAAELQTAFAEKPQLLSELQAWSDKLRIVSDAPSVNPSGTAKTASILGIIHKIGTLVSHPASALGDGMKILADRFEAAKNKSSLNNIMSGQTAQAADAAVNAKINQYSVMRSLEKAAQSTTKKVATATQAIFDDAPRVGAALDKSKRTTRNLNSDDSLAAYRDKIKEVQGLASNPEGLLNKMTDATDPIYSHAPQITQGLHQAVVNGVQFLASKVVQHPPAGAMAKAWVPSRSEIAHFNRYYDVVQNPTIALDQIKSGTLTPESVEALAAVTPKLYNEMKSQIVEKLVSLQSKETPVPYRTRLMLSLFLGHDLDGATSPQAIMDNQTALNTQSQPAPGGGPRPTKSGASKLTNSDRIQTPMQQSSQRGA